MRLRRTIAGIIVLLLAAVVTVRLISRGGDTEPAAVTATSSPAVAAPTTPATAPGNEDGSSATETTATRTTVPQSGNGKLTVVSVPPMKNSATGRAVHYTVEIEGGLAAGSRLLAILLPGLVSAAIGYTIFVGLGSWGGINEAPLRIPDLPSYTGTNVRDLAIGLAVGVAAAFAISGVMALWAGST